MRLLLACFALLLATPALAEDGATLQGAGDFTLPDINDTPVTLSEQLGDKVVLINFWATWCGPCLKEMPKLDAIQKELGDGLQVISISTDDPKDKAKVKAIVKRMKYTPMVLLDTETRVVSEYNPNKDMPFTIIIGKDKLIHHKKKGFTEGDEEKLKHWVEELIKAG
jgi:thiol-disulfide isomerase/thioredoxin